MANRAVAAAPEAISETSAKTQITDRPNETQAVVITTHADGTTTGNALSVVGESSQDARHISSASADKTQVMPDAPDADAPTKTPQSIAPVPAGPEQDLGSVPTADVLPLKRDGVTHPSDQSVSVLTSERANALFPVENYGTHTAEELHNTNIENFREGERLLGKVIAHTYDRVLPAINETVKRLKNGEEINGFSGERQVGAYLESIGYTAGLVRQWNKRYHDRMAKLKEALGLTGNGDANLMADQRELRDTLIEQGYKNPDATRLAKAAEGDSIIERFNWVMAQRASEIRGTGTGTQDIAGAINPATEESNSEPPTEATETSTAIEPGGVTTVTGVAVGELDADAESDLTISSPEKEIPEKPSGLMIRSGRVPIESNKYYEGNKKDGKHYWLTPQSYKEDLERRYPGIVDVLPYPRPAGYNALKVPWHKINYANIPFGTTIEPDGTRVGLTAWARKIVEEQAKGNTTIVPYPLDNGMHILLNAGATFRSIGQIFWVATEDGSVQASSRKIVEIVVPGNDPVE